VCLWGQSLHLRAESVFVKAHDGGPANFVVDGDNIETQRAVRLDAALAEEKLGGAHQHVLFARSHAEFGQGGEFFANGARAHLDKGEGLAVITDHIDFALDSAGMVIAGYKYVA